MYYRQQEKKEDEENQAYDLDDLTIVKMSEQIDYILNKENNKELIILREQLKNYKKELEDNLKSGKPIEHEQFKKFLHNNLERLLFYIIYIPNKDIRDDKLRALYRWYFEKLDHFQSLDKISFRTDKNIDEVYKKEDVPSDEILIKDDQFEEEEFRKHRTEIQGLEPPKDRLRDFKVKKVNPPKKFKKDEKVLADLRFNLDRFHGRVGSANSSISMKSTFYATKTGKKWVSNSGIGVTDELKPIDAKKEIKGGYSYVRPEYEFSKLVIEKEIITAKNKELKEKRNEEEMKIYLDEFGKAKAHYKEEKERKFNHANIVSACSKTFKVEKKDEELQEEDEDVLDDVKSVKSDVVNEENIFDPNSINDKSNINNKIVYTKIENLPKKETEDEKQILKKKTLMEKNLEQINTTFTIYLEADRKKLIKNLEETKDTMTTIKPDTFALAVVDDRVLKARMQSAKICNVKEIHGPKLGYTHHFVPLSAFDYMNYQTYGDEPVKPKPKLERPKTASEFAMRNFDKYSENFLELRRKMNEYKQEEIDRMTDMVFNGDGCSKKINNFENASVMPKVGGARTNYYYPRPATSLLPRPPEIPGKKKRRPKSKKKF